MYICIHFYSVLTLACDYVTITVSLQNTAHEDNSALVQPKPFSPSQPRQHCQPLIILHLCDVVISRTLHELNHITCNNSRTARSLSLIPSTSPSVAVHSVGFRGVVCMSHSAKECSCLLELVLCHEILMSSVILSGIFGGRTCSL
jgi:hypothetical protein